MQYFCTSDAIELPCLPWKTPLSLFQGPADPKHRGWFFSAESFSGSISEVSFQLLQKILITSTNKDNDDNNNNDDNKNNDDDNNKNDNDNKKQQLQTRQQQIRRILPWEQPLQRQKQQRQQQQKSTLRR